MARLARAACLCAVFAAGGAATGPQWFVQTSGLATDLRGISVVLPSGRDSKAIIWATGSRGVILRSDDSGKTWNRLHIPQGDSLDFRDVKAWGENIAYVMSTGDAPRSRIYKTSDAGKTWELQYTDSRKAFFLDSLACVSRTNCFAICDPIDGKFVLLHTEDGKLWKEIPNMPAALPQEGSFAASGSILITHGRHDVYFGTGGPAARVFHSPDLGHTWTGAETPMLSGKPSFGIFSIARKGNTVVAVGGDYQSLNRAEKNAAYSLDKGKTWQLAAEPPGGFRSAVALFNGGYVAVGPGGADISRDGIHWTHADAVSLNALSFARGQGWGAGPHGTVAHFLDHAR